jgi:hypothetical protein
MLQPLEPSSWLLSLRAQRARWVWLAVLPVLAVLLASQPSGAEDKAVKATTTTSFQHLKRQIFCIVGSSPHGPLHVLPWLDTDLSDLMTKHVVPLPEKGVLDTIETTIPQGVEDRVPIRSSNVNYWEAQGYWQLVVRGQKFSAEAFAEKARKDVHFVHLWEEPVNYRAAIVHVQGILRRVRRFDVPEFARKQGVQNRYEGWLTEDRDGRNLWCVIFTELPPGLELGDKLAQEVSFDGYFFKLYGYPRQLADGKTEWHAAPLLIGHAPVLRPPAQADSTWSMTEALLPAFLGFVGGVIVLTAVLGWWFRRNDQRVRLRLEAARQAGVVVPDAVAPPPDGNS